MRSGRQLEREIGALWPGDDADLAVERVGDLGLGRDAPLEQGHDAEAQVEDRLARAGDREELADGLRA